MSIPHLCYAYQDRLLAVAHADGSPRQLHDKCPYCVHAVEAHRRWRRASDGNRRYDSPTIKLMIACVHPKYGHVHAAVLFCLLLAFGVIFYVGAFYFKLGTLITAAAHTFVAATVFSIFTLFPEYAPKKWDPERRQWLPKTRHQMGIILLFVFAALCLFLAGVASGCEVVLALGVNLIITCVVRFCSILIASALDELPNTESRTVSTRATASARRNNSENGSSPVLADSPNVEKPNLKHSGSSASSSSKRVTFAHQVITSPAPAASSESRRPIEEKPEEATHSLLVAGSVQSDAEYDTAPGFDSDSVVVTVHPQQ